MGDFKDTTAELRDLQDKLGLSGAKGGSKATTFYTIIVFAREYT